MQFVCQVLKGNNLVTGPGFSLLGFIIVGVIVGAGEHGVVVLRGGAIVGAGVRGGVTAAGVVFAVGHEGFLSLLVAQT